MSEAIRQNGMRIDHFGIVVRSISEHIERYLSPLLGGAKRGPIIHDPLQRVNVCFLGTPDSGRIELIEPNGDDSPVAAFAKKRPGGFHHICFEVDDLDDSLFQCRKAQMVIVSAPNPAVAFDGRRIAFVMSRDSLLWELLEKQKDA